MAGISKILIKKIINVNAASYRFNSKKSNYYLFKRGTILIKKL